MTALQHDAGLAYQSPDALLHPQRRSFLDPIFGPLGRAAKCRKTGCVAAEIDRIVAPQAGSDHAPVEIEYTRKFGAIEPDLKRRRARKMGDDAHQAQSRSPVGRAASRAFAFSASRSSIRLASRQRIDSSSHFKISNC